MNTNPAPPQHGEWTRGVIGAAVTAALGGLLFGYDTGVISGALQYIQQSFALSSWTSGFVVSAILVGAMVGAATAGPIADRYGRRTVLIASSVVFFIGGLAAALAPTVTALIIARVVLGLAIGAASNLVPLFIAEVAPSRIRGRLVAVNQLMITVGIVLAYGANYALGEVSGDWRWMFALSSVPAMAFGIGMFAMPETPRWLVLRGMRERARGVLVRMRRRADVDDELTEIVDSASQTTDKSKLDRSSLRQRGVVLALIAGIGLQLFGQASGLNTVIYYAPTIFENSGLGSSSSALATVGVGLVNMLMTLVGMSMIDKFGRKTLLLGGSSVMALSLGVLAVDLSMGTDGGVTSWIAVICVLVFIAAVAASVTVVIFVIPSELYPLRIRGGAMSVTMFANWAMNFFVSLTFLSLLEQFGGVGTFAMYAVICALLVAFTARFIPETKGRSLEEIEQSLASKK